MLRLQVRVAELQQQLSSLSPALISSADEAAAELAGEGINLAYTSKHSANLTLQMVVSELREELQRQSDLTRNEMLQRQKAEAMLRDATANLHKEVLYIHRILRKIEINKIYARPTILHYTVYIGACINFPHVNPRMYLYWML